MVLWMISTKIFELDALTYNVGTTDGWEVVVVEWWSLSLGDGVSVSNKGPTVGNNIKDGASGSNRGIVRSIIKALGAWVSTIGTYFR